ncbi:hypothetical protein EYF80_023714 [Liparis tanakae]|uniref:Uncharacterized protein n=1 Tax=Liparis tanakae TaxID=230148 RepID=A0A4Z2HJZ4_9TELE|nr:hypothetical protein EYF80_023714 [Liparis tanakae]
MQMQLGARRFSSAMKFSCVESMKAVRRYKSEIFSLVESEDTFTWLDIGMTTNKLFDFRKGKLATCRGNAFGKCKHHRRTVFGSTFLRASSDSFFRTEELT